MKETTADKIRDDKNWRHIKDLLELEPNKKYYANPVECFDPFEGLEFSISDYDSCEVYLPLSYRLLWFRLTYPKGRTETTLINYDGERKSALVEARVYSGEGSDTLLSNAYALRCAYDIDGEYEAEFLSVVQSVALSKALGYAGFGTPVVGGNRDKLADERNRFEAAVQQERAENKAAQESQDAQKTSAKQVAEAKAAVVGHVGSAAPELATNNEKAEQAVKQKADDNASLPSSDQSATSVPVQTTIPSPAGTTTMTLEDALAAVVQHGTWAGKTFASILESADSGYTLKALKWLSSSKSAEDAAAAKTILAAKFGQDGTSQNK